MRAGTEEEGRGEKVPLRGPKSVAFMAPSEKMVTQSYLASVWKRKKASSTRKPAGGDSWR